jgi:hypothetical protein
LGLGRAVSFLLLKNVSGSFGQFYENNFTLFLCRAVLWVNFFHTFVFVSGRLEGGLWPFTLLFLCSKHIFRDFFGSMIFILFLEFGMAIWEGIFEGLS